MNRVYLWILVLLLALALAGPLLAQVSLHFDLSWHLLSGGGGSRSSAHYQIDDVLGQWADGQSGSVHYQVDPGFWGRGNVSKTWRLYLPAQEAVPGSNWQAGIQVQNSGTATAIIGFNGIAANGAKTDCGQVETPPGGSANFLTLWGCPAGHPVFSAGVASSDQPGAAIASIGNAPAGVAGGQYRGMNAADASKVIFFPLVKHNHNKRTTAFSVQNAGDQPSAIRPSLKSTGRPTARLTAAFPPRLQFWSLPPMPMCLAAMGRLAASP